MTVLRIANGKGEFSLDGKNFKLIDEITKEDVFQIIELVITQTEIDFEELSEERKIEHVAQNIVYTNLLSKLKELKARRKSIIDESKAEFAEAVTKYSSK